MKRKNILIICVIIFLIILLFAFILLKNENVSQNNYKSSKNIENCFEIAIKSLNNNANGPIEKLLDGNKVIYFEDDILVVLSYKVTNLNYSIGFDTKSATYSINENRFINDIELSNMQYTDSWKSAQIETIPYDLVLKMNKKYF